jgi:hypothetical protein
MIQRTGSCTFFLSFSLHTLINLILIAHTLAIVIPVYTPCVDR